MRQRNADAAAPLPAGGVRWLDTDLSGVAENLALDEALLEEAHDGRLHQALVRTWMAGEPTVVLGSSSRIDEEVDIAACERLGVRVVRRPSGGLTVLLGPGCLMWSVIVRHAQAAPAIDRVHGEMLEPLCGALCAAGRPVVRRGSSDLAVAVDGLERKVSGNALRVRRHAVLYHGTLLDSFDLPLVTQVLRHPPREPGYRAGRDHGAFLANLELGRPALEAAVRAAFNADTVRGDWPEERVATLVRERYADPAWTCRLR
ncbi:MAG: lipoate--protein ligase family protein [Planctomycetia bacterium]|jgi:lipoate-protein ligase A|nr:lipoate--protein ligase family protein [Planctomycetia bacterium]